MSLNNEKALPEGERTLSLLVVVVLTSFLAPFMSSAITVAMPALQEDLGVHAIQLSWIANVYLLSFAVFLVPAGRLADIHGRKRLFLTGLSVFTLATICSVPVRNIAGFLTLRAVQGAGAAAVVTTGLALLIAAYPARGRGRAIGLNVTAVYLGLSAGPFVGGILVGLWGWRSIFVVCALLGGGAWALAFKCLREECAESCGEPFDWTGSLLYGASLILVLFGVTLFPSSRAFSFLVPGLVAGLMFVLHELRIDYPVFELRLFARSRVFAFSSLAALISYASTFAVSFLLSLYLQYIRGLSAQAAGSVLVAQPLVQAAFSPLAGRLSDRAEPGLIASAGMAVTAAGLLLLVFVDQRTPMCAVVGVLCLLGLGYALFSSPNTNAIMSSVDSRYYGIASGTVATMRSVGMSVSMAMATVAFAVRIGPHAITVDRYPAFLDAMHELFVIFVVLCLAGTACSMARGRLRS